MRVKEFRLNSGLTQEQVAKILGINQPTYNRKEKGVRSFNVEELLKLEILFNVTISDMFKEKKEELEEKINRG